MTRTPASPRPSTSASSWPTPWATTPCWSTPTSSSRPPAGSTACASGPTRRAARPPWSAPACSTRTACIQHAGVIFSLLDRDWLHRYRFGPANLPEALKTTRCIVTAALQFIRWETLDQIGLYDEGYRLCFEDVDYCLRVFKAGLECIYEPSVVAMHHESFFRRNATPEIDRWTQESTARMRGAVGRRRPVPLGSGDAVMEIPKTLFMSRGNKGPAWYRCALPALALGRRLDVLRRRAAERPLPARPHRPPPDDRRRAGLRRRRASSSRAAPSGSARSATGSAPAWSSSPTPTTGCAASASARITTSTRCSVARRSRSSSSACVPSTASSARRRGWPSATASLNPRTYVCRNGIDLKRYALTRPERDYVGVGWSGATGHKNAMQPWLAEIAADHARARPT